MFNTLSTVKFFYDENGVLIRESLYDGLDQEPFSEIHYTYDEQGNIIREQHTGSNTHVIINTYNEDGNCVTETIMSNGDVISYNFEYDEHGRMVKEINSDDVIEYIYDDKTTGPIQQISVFFNYSYEYDNHDNIICLIDNITGEKTYYKNEYDERNRLIRFNVGNTLHEMEYDDNDNIIKEIEKFSTPDGIITIIRTIIYDENNRCICRVTEHIHDFECGMSITDAINTISNFENGSGENNDDCKQSNTD